jgi:pyruvate,orthophosphate dikinase
VAKLVYSFAQVKTDGNAGMKDLLGGKGANLAEMTRLGIPVPPGFTISTRACNLYFENRHRLPADLKKQVATALRRLERQRGKRFGDVEDPLLVSVRSGAKFSMPGMMDTILNLGLNDRSVEGLARTTGDRRFAFDSYRRFIQMYGDVVLELGKRPFDDLLNRLKAKRRVTQDTDLQAKDWESLVRQYKEVIKKGSGKAFPQDPERQLWGAITAVFRSWENPRAQLYRQRYGIARNLGTGVNVQCMVFGNLGDDCATGVAFTRDPSTGADILYGEYLQNAQGEDVVAGVRTPRPISRKQADDGDHVSLEELMPASYKELQRIRRRLENHYKDMQDVEFTIERGKLYMLQTRTGKRTGQAALNVAFDLHDAGKISRKEVVLRVEPEMIVQLLAPIFDPSEMAQARSKGRIVARGLPAGPGAASGVIAFSAKEAVELSARGKSVLLVRGETSPEDIGGMMASVGIVTSRGGMTSHAAVVARGMGKPCVVGAEALHVDEERRRVRVGGRVLHGGDVLSIDGSTGEIVAGKMEPHPSEIHSVLVGKKLKANKSRLFQRFAKLTLWADGFRKLGVRTNADTPEDSAVARAFGAEGIGLCRTEHMFFGEDRISAVRQMILSDSKAERARALKKLLPMQRKDFVGIFKAMDGLPVTIRLLDPPLHEFLPNQPAQIRGVAKEMGVPVKVLEERAEQLREMNPMMGHRGCRLGISYPEIYEMQARAIFEAAVSARSKGVKVAPEVMIPLVGTVEEYRELDLRIREIAREIESKSKRKLGYKIGTMIEIPRACLVAGEIAKEAEFFSFGTNDLTQLTYGYSRDDAGKFLADYVEKRILPGDPFQSLDREGVGQLIEWSIRKGREARKNLKVGVCGEHGGDPASVEFFHGVGADYVSCSPYRVPVARLAAAHAALTDGKGGGSGTA